MNSAGLPNGLTSSIVVMQDLLKLNYQISHDVKSSTEDQTQRLLDAINKIGRYAALCPNAAFG
jgi:hypothetical protein